MYTRLVTPLKKQSFFLFGARGTGKSTFLDVFFANEKNIIKIDLLDQDIHFKLLKNPSFLEELIASNKSKKLIVVIDEIQKNPILLDTVHRLIEKHKIVFALTGSSARKLKRSGVNLLAGRALQNYLHPLTHIELGKDFSLKKNLEWGALPFLSSVKSELQKKEYLKSYYNTYIKEEIREEQIVRKIEPFLRFLEVAAQQNGEESNFSNIARDAGIETSSVERFFEILIDTLLMFELPPFHLSVRKRQSKRSKYYFFDLGVKRAISSELGTTLTPSSYSFGRAFEHFFILECFRLNDYFRTDYRFTYLRTKDNCEIDLIVETPQKKYIAIEIKSATNLYLDDFNSQANLISDLKKSEFWVAYLGTETRKSDKVQLFPWQTALAKLFKIK
jgi:predicted AAA+ superfamily ATPase